MGRKESARARTGREKVPAGAHAPVLPFLLSLAAAVLSVPSLALPPEGDVRGGDASMVVFGWFLLAGGVLAVRLFFPVGRARFADFAVLLLTAWTAFSFYKLKATNAGNLLYAANGFWVFTLMPLAYFVFRQIPKTAHKHFERFFFAAVLGVCFLEAGISLHDRYVTAPTLRARFREDPQALLAESGLGIREGTPEYLLFEKRLLESSEPLGTYGLTNTLAGILTPALLLLTGVFAAGFMRCGDEDDSGKRIRDSLVNGLGVLTALILGYTLLLTKSRSGYLALFLGVLAIVLFLIFGEKSDSTQGNRRRKAGFVPALIILGFILAATVSLHLGILDREVFSEAKKSLGYRLDYWKATSAIIADFPLLGVGPGNFQSTYTRYILPTAAETIADPHNFAFEYGSLFGIPAVLLFGLFLGSTAHAGVRKTVSQSVPPEPIRYTATFFLFLGGYILYAIFNFLTSAPTAMPILLGFAPLFLAFSPLAAIFASKMARLPSPLLLVALGAGLLNLCAAGGIGYPPTALPLWGLAAILVNRLDSANPKREAVVPPKKVSTWVFGFIYGFFFVLFLRGAFFPVLTEKTLIPRLAELPPDAAEKELETAAQKWGRHSIPILWSRSDMAMYRHAALPSPQREDAWLKAKKDLLVNAPNQASLRAELGDVEFALYGETQNRVFLTEACKSFTEASALFPTDATLHARYATALNAAGWHDQALREKEVALRLDAVTPHEDRKVPESVKSLLTLIGENE